MRYTITRKIAKQGDRAVVTIPKMLAKELRPGTVVQLQIETLRRVKG